MSCEDLAEKPKLHRILWIMIGRTRQWVQKSRRLKINNFTGHEKSSHFPRNRMAQFIRKYRFRRLSKTIRHSPSKTSWQNKLISLNYIIFRLYPTRALEMTTLKFWIIMRLLRTLRKIGSNSLTSKTSRTVPNSLNKRDSVSKPQLFWKMRG